jgi:serine/threonine-protein kinase HipA
VKFDCTGEFAGRIDHETKIEASYLEMARDCGLRVPEFELVTREGRDHLVLRRFDRTPESALHLHSFWGLAHASAGSRMHDYEFLHRAVLRLTGNAQEMAECFGRMAFNILACNQDDHSKQHAFLFDGTKWNLAPAFDLTFSPNPTLGHAMPLLGNPSPSHTDLLAFARKMDVPNGGEILERIQTVVSSAKSYLNKNQVPERSTARVVEGISRKRNELCGKS